MKPQLTHTRSQDHRRRRWMLTLIALAIAAAYFGVRGPARVSHSGSADFALIHGSTTAWAKAENPYDSETVARIWEEAGGSNLEYLRERGNEDLLYPPSAFLILSPFALTGARAGLVVWAMLSAAAAVFAAVVAARLAGLGSREPAFWLVIAAMLALAPGHTNFNVGQSAHIVLGLLALAYAARLWKPTIAGNVACGVFLGAACALKPQVGLPFLAFELLFARWTAVLAGGATGLLLLALGGARLWLADIDWISAWRANIDAFKAGGAGNPAAANEWRYQMTSLHYPLHAFLNSAWIVNGIVLLVCSALTIWFWTLRRRTAALGGRHGLSRGASRASTPAHTPASGTAQDTTESGPHLLDISMAAVLSLLFFYHRFYDAVVLIFPVTVALTLLARGRRIDGLALLAPLAVFLVPGAAALYAAERRGLVPEWLSGTLLWEGIIMPHQVWALLAIAVVLTWLARRRWLQA